MSYDMIKSTGGCCVLQKLKYFQSVVRLNSFSEAAEENFISQSAISQQIQALERELGFQLLERKNRGFTLTSAGEYFYPKSLLLTADYERMCSEAAKIAKGDRASLKIGYLRTYAGSEFQRALSVFSARHPDVSVTVEYGNHDELCDFLALDRVELTFNDQRRVFSDAYVNRILTALPALAEVSAHSPLAQMGHISPAELKNFPCILIAPPPQRDAERDYARLVLGVESEFLFAENMEEARLMVISGKGAFITGSTFLIDGAQRPAISMARFGPAQRGKTKAFFGSDFGDMTLFFQSAA